MSNSDQAAPTSTPPEPGKSPIPQATPPHSSAVPAEPQLPSALSLFTPSQRLVNTRLSSFVWFLLIPSFLIALLDLNNNIQLIVGDAVVWLFGLLAIVLLYELLVFAPLLYLELRLAQGKQLGPKQAFRESLHYFWRLVGLYISVGFLVVVGLLLLIVPGIIMIRRYFLAGFFLIDNNLGIGEAMRQSAAATKGRAGAVWGVIGVQILLTLPGIVPIVGSFVGAVLTMLYACAPAMRYEQIKALPRK